jgi:soluble lytic murein transglycosylase
MIDKFIRGLLLAANLLLTGAAVAQTPGADVLASQRALFLQTRALLQNGATTAAGNLGALRDYPLYPYLELIQLTAALDRQTNENVDNFLQRYNGTPVAEQLRNQWLAVLATTDHWTDYLKYYRAADASKLQQCWSLEALFRSGQNDLALQETAKLWLNTDLPDACDAPFKRWLASNQRSESLIWKRLLLALDKKQEALARALAVEIREPYHQQAEFALQLYRDPAALNNLLPQILQNVEASAVLAQALKNSARLDADAATATWQQLLAANRLTREDSNEVRRELGRRQVAEKSFDALPWLLQYDPNGEDSYLLEWRVRLALRDGNWPQIANWITQMPAEMAQSSRWNYWLARALNEQNDDPAKQKRALDIVATLAKERGFYGFLAADWLKSPYQLNDQRLEPKVAADAVAQKSGVLRAREFFLLGEQASARREWQFALRSMNSDEQLRAALLAEQWGWHDQTIRTANQTGATNDMRLRFPIGHRDSMVAAAKATALPLQWLFAITRQESAFMADARSPVGALGLMQLMPDTARQVARGLRTRVSTDELVQPATNILLGSNYLNELAQRYDGNRILATAAYNAGPNRISRLLKAQTATLPADVWVETLPYKETREYVQNVLAFSVIYGERLGQPISLLKNSERKIGNATAALSASATCTPAPNTNC